MRHDVQTKSRGSAIARQRGPGRIGRGQTGAFGIARHGPTLRIGQVLGKPGLALRKRLRMRKHRFDLAERVGRAQQMVPHQQTDFADHMRRRMQEQVERTRDDAFGRVLDADDTVLRAAGGGRMKDFVEAGAIDQVGRAAEIFDGSLLAERALGSEHRNPLRRFERQAGRHDFSPDRGDMVALERTAAAFLHLLDDLRHAIRAEERRALPLLDLADQLGDMRSPVQ